MNTLRPIYTKQPLYAQGGAGWPSTTGNPSGGGRDNNTSRGK